MKYRFHTEYSIASYGFSMAVIAESHDASRAFLQPLVWKKFDPNTAIPSDEVFAIKDDFGAETVKNFLQAAMDAAWDIGLRPTQAQNQTDELKAVRYHLEDMRTLALKTA